MLRQFKNQNNMVAIRKTSRGSLPGCRLRHAVCLMTKVESIIKKSCDWQNELFFRFYPDVNR